jgi:hypothetical protein
VKINIGNFGYSEREVTPVVDKSGVGNALIATGGRIQNTLDDIQRNREALQRAKAANAVVSYQLAVEETGRGLEEDLASGAVNWENADAEYGERVKKLEVPQFELDNAIDRENSNGAIAHAQERGRLAIQPQVFAARQRDGVAQLDQFFDTQAKRAIEPSANVDQINASADAFAANAREYGIPADVLARRVQDFKDANYFNQATQRAVEADEDLTSLRAVLHDVTAEDGYYAKRLDPTKRNALQYSIQTRIDRIEMRAQAAVDRREARAEHAIRQIDTQISTGIPATPAMWAEWADTVKGTTVEPVFNQMVATEQAIQQVLRAPIAEQKRIVQDAQTRLKQEGGTVAQNNNVNRLSAAVDANIKMLTQTPVLFSEQRLGDKNVELDVADFASPDAQPAVAQVVAERVNRIRALEKQFGTRVQMAPLLPQEAKGLADALNGASPDSATKLFGSIAAIAQDPQVYRGIMQQVAPDSPVRTYAGQIFGHRAPLVGQERASGPDQRVAQAVVASTIVQGEAIINKTREQKGEDGKPVKNMYVPDKAAFDQAFSDHVGNAFADRPDALELTQQVAYSYYVGKSAKTGRLNQQGVKIDDNLMEETLHAAIGDVSNFHGYGNVILPLGMDKDQFQVATRQQFVAEVGGDPRVANDAFRSLGLRNLEGSRYIFTKGREYFRLKGKPIIIDLAKPLPPKATPAPLSDQFVPM